VKPSKFWNRTNSATSFFALESITVTPEASSPVPGGNVPGAGLIAGCDEHPATPIVATAIATTTDLPFTTIPLLAILKGNLAG
jgi:hypothetical protein